jgi:hypothetical protein
MVRIQSPIVSLVGNASHAFADQPAGRDHGQGGLDEVVAHEDGRSFQMLVGMPTGGGSTRTPCPWIRQSAILEIGF